MTEVNGTNNKTPGSTTSPMTNPESVGTSLEDKNAPLLGQQNHDNETTLKGGNTQQEQQTSSNNPEDDMTKNRTTSMAPAMSSNNNTSDKFKGISSNEDTKKLENSSTTSSGDSSESGSPSTNLSITSSVFSPSSAGQVDLKSRFQGISSKDSKPVSPSTTTKNPPPLTKSTSSSNRSSTVLSAPVINQPKVEKPRSSSEMGRDQSFSKTTKSTSSTNKKGSLTMPSQNRNKIVVIGCRGIGKSEMVYKFLYNEIRYYHQLTKEKQTLVQDLKTTVSGEKKEEKRSQASSLPLPPSPITSNNITNTTGALSSSPTQVTAIAPEPKEPIKEASTPTINSLPTDVNQIVEEDIDFSIKPTDSFEVRQLKLLILKKETEIKKQKEEMDHTIQELTTMWKKERTEKLELEQEYVEQENELNHYISVVQQINQLINIDPNSTDLPESLSFKLPEANPNNSILSPNRKRKLSSHHSVNPTLATPKPVINSPAVVTPIQKHSHHPSENQNDDNFDLASFVPKENVILPPVTTPASLQRKARHVRTESTFQKLRANQYQVVAQDFRKSIEEDLDVSDPETNSIAVASNDTNEEEINNFLLEFNKSDETNSILLVSNQISRNSQPISNNPVKITENNSDGSDDEEDTENDYSESSDIMSVSSTASSGHTIPKIQSVVELSRERSPSGGLITANTVVSSSISRSKSPTVVQSTDYKYDENLFFKLLTPSFHLTEGLRRFNTGKPKDAIKYLIENNILPDPEKGLLENDEQPEAVIARFLAIADSLNKEKLGEFLSEPKNSVYLEEFVKFHVLELYKEEKKAGDDTYLSKFDRAIRSFFIQFKLPKEGQQVTRIAEVFANVYSKFNKDDGELNGNDEACYLLVCSILMVNTQLHNPNANIKLSRDQFVSLFSSYSDVNLAFVGTCYDSVARNAMVLYDEELDKEDRTNFESDDQIELFFKCYKPRQHLVSSTSEQSFHSHRAQKSLSLDGDKVKELMESAITFYFKAKVIHGGIINRIQIKDSDPNLELSTSEIVNESGTAITKVKLKDPTEVYNEAKAGNYFICAYSVADKTSFLIVEHIIKAIRKIKRKERKRETKKSKSSKSKSGYSTLTGSVTEELFEKLNGDDSDYNNDKFMVLVGCKADVPEDQRQVTKKEGGELALKYSIPFFEVSNHDMKGVRKVFLNSIDSIKRQNASYVDAVKQMNDFHKRINIARQNKKGQIDVNSLAILPKCYI